MSNIWELEDWGGELRLRSHPIKKETMQFFYLDREGGERRVEKRYLDTLPNLALSRAYGRFFTSREKALEIWFGFFTCKLRHTERVIHAIAALRLDPELGVASYKEKKDDGDHRVPE